MYHLAYIFLIITILNWHPFRLESKLSDQEVWLVNASSSLRVDGKTNIVNFTCLVSCYGKTDTLIYKLNQSNLPYFKINSVLDIPVANFDCHHKIMTKDLQKTLKMK